MYTSHSFQTQPSHRSYQSTEWEEGALLWLYSYICVFVQVQSCDLVHNGGMSIHLHPTSTNILCHGNTVTSISRNTAQLKKWLHKLVHVRRLREAQYPQTQSCSNGWASVICEKMKSLSEQLTILLCILMKHLGYGLVCHWMSIARLTIRCNACYVGGKTHLCT